MEGLDSILHTTDYAIPKEGSLRLLKPDVIIIKYMTFLLFLKNIYHYLAALYFAIEFQANMIVLCV